jgi:steroid 5-alpha reductase family enzyme
LLSLNQTHQTICIDLGIDFIFYAGVINMMQWLMLMLCVFMIMAFFFLLSIPLRRNDIVDVGWGLGFALIAWAAYVLGDASGNVVIINWLVTLWAVRLVLHTGLRMIGKPEDSRYAAWRHDWKTFFYLRSFIYVYLLQGILMFVVTLPVAWANLYGAPVHPVWWFGLCVWIVGFSFEAIGDWQLKRFLADSANRGKICTVGLWRYTRHPNYFGEVTLWWGIYLMTLPHAAWYITLAGPLCITWLILYVSGVPLLEKPFEKNLAFQAYKNTTSAFFPWFPQS